MSAFTREGVWKCRRKPSEYMGRAKSGEASMIRDTRFAQEVEIQLIHKPRKRQGYA